MEELEQIPQNPFDKLSLHIQYPRQLPRTIPEDLVQALLREAYSEYRRRGEDLRVLRDIVVLELLFSTGIRVSELCKLSPETVQLSEHKLRLLISGKGRKERIIQIETPEILHILRIYCCRCGEQIHEANALLLNNRKMPVSAPAPCRTAGHAAYVPPYIRHLAAGGRYGYPIYPGPSWTQLHFHNTNLYPCGGGTADGAPSGAASERKNEFHPLIF